MGKVAVVLRNWWTWFGYIGAQWMPELDPTEGKTIRSLAELYTSIR